MAENTLLGGHFMRSFPSNPMIRDCRAAKRKPSIPLQILIFFLVFLIPTILSGFLIAIPAVILSVVHSGTNPETILSSPSMTIVNLFMTVLTTGSALLYCLCIEKRSLRSMGLGKGSFLKSYGKGLLIGTGLLLVCCGISWLFGGFRVSFPCTLTPVYFLLFFLGFVIQGSSEEILLRGYFMMSLSNRCTAAWAVGLSSVLFSLLHIFNPGFGLLPLVNIALFGVFMGLYVFREGDLWGACAIHTAWNFVQGNILGIQVSGGAVTPTLWQFKPTAGMELLNGGAFGIEASVVVTVVLSVACAWTYFSKKQRNAPTDREI